MPGDISRRTFDRDKRYAGVLAQQGRVLSDADLNEQVEISQYRTHTEASDVIGGCGVPKLTGGFRLELLGDGADLAISAGRAYVGGLLCELDSTAVPLTFPQGLAANRAVIPAIVVDGRRIDVDQWVEIAAPGRPSKVLRIVAIDAIASVTVTFSEAIGDYRVAGVTMRRVTTYATQGDYPDPEHVGPAASPPMPHALQLSNGVWLAYLVAWQREINANDDPLIRETALGGVDTATRVKNVWQVRLLEVTPDGRVSCGSSFPEWTALLAPAPARLNARTNPGTPPTSACILPPQAGFRRLENQLYRVEIQREGGIGQATFKWSRENGSVETRVRVNGNTMTADDLGRDDVLGFAGGQWVELVDEESVLTSPPHDLIQIDAPEEATREITTGANIAAFSGKSRLKLRRWDQTGSTATKNGIVIQSGWMDLEDGIQVQFSGGGFRPGDHWLIPARTGTGDIEWPPFEMPNTRPLPQPPAGIVRHYCRLAILTVGNGRITSVLDCRDLFPPLTAISAADVDYNPASCQSLRGVTNVQEALDTLCQVTVGICTFTGVPGMSVQAVFDRIPAGGDAEVCFPAGTYTLDKPVLVKGKGHLKVSGTGPGTRMIAANSEAALIFDTCRSVAVRDLHASSGRAGVGGALEHQYGTLTFGGCGEVEVSDVSLRCGRGPRRSVTCITVAGPSSAALTSPSARIVRTTLDVDHFQTGILIVNASRSHVEDNVIRAVRTPGLARPGPGGLFDDLLLDRMFRRALRGRLVSNAVLGARPPAGGATNAKIDVGGKTILFRTHPLLKQEWSRLVDANPPPQNATQVQLLGHLKQLAERVIDDARFRAANPKLREWFEAARLETEPIGAQGIVIGGDTARDVRVVSNTIDRMMQGIHVGLSHTPDDNRLVTDIAGTVRIQGNTVAVRIAEDALRNARHAVFVGNCDSLVIEDTFAELTTTKGSDNVPASGIIAWGHIGRRAIVRHNHLKGFRTGVEFVPRFPFPSASQVLWMIANNMLEGATTAIGFPPAPHNNPPVDQSGNKQS